MAGISRFNSSIKDISRLFAGSKRLVFTYAEMEEIFEENRQIWRLPQSMNTDRFLIRLVEKLNFKEIELNFAGLQSRRLYAHGNPEKEEIATAAFPRAYLSHFTASSINGLTEQIPKTVYLTVEQSVKQHADPQDARNNLLQENIDKAFQKPQRISEAVAEWDDVKYVLLRGKATGNMGVRAVGDVKNVRVTDLERTLVDITVRPSYSGGVFEVLKAYQNAGESGKFSVNKLLSYLKRMDFIYPYQQAVGFYMELSRAFKPQQVERLKELKTDLNFYLAYDMKETDYAKDWNIYYPKGIR